jgi:hypothetical protein
MKKSDKPLFYKRLLVLIFSLLSVAFDILLTWGKGSPQSKRERTHAMNVKIFQKGGERRDARITKIITWMGRQLMSTRMNNLLTIRVEMRASTLKNAHGCVFQSLKGSATKGAGDWRNKRAFKIVVIRDVVDRDLVRILAHEMVHVRQMATRQLAYRYIKTTKTWRKTWMGVDHSSTPYRDCPWEVEAYGLDKGLAAAFINRNVVAPNALDTSNNLASLLTNTIPSPVAVNA